MKIRFRLNISVNRAIEILLWYLFVSNVSESLFSPLFAVFVTKNIVGASLATVGFAAAVYAVAKSIVQLPVAKKIEKADGEKDDFYVMLVGSTAGIIYAIAMIFVQSAWQIYLISAINGAGAACVMAAYYGIFSRHADKGSEGFEWSLFSVWGGTLSTAVGGAIGGVLADAVGFQNVLIAVAVLQLIATIFLVALYPSLNRHRERPSLPNVPMS